MPSVLETPMSYDFGVYMDVVGDGKKYERWGEGIDTFTPSQNPQVSTRQYIHQKNATSRVTSLQKQYAYAGERVIGDPVNDYLDSLEDKTGSDVETTMVGCDLKATATAGAYPAKRYKVTVAVSNPGDLSGGGTQAISGTIYVNGDPEDGTFDPSTGVFTATAA